MSFQYNTKTVEELQSIAKVISDNFSELVGCVETSKLWSPPTASNVCNALMLAGYRCSNITDQYDDTSSVLSYKFISSTNNSMKDIWTKVLNFDTSIYDMDKLFSVKINSKLSIENKLKICINQSKEYESDLMIAALNNKKVLYSEDYKRLMWIMLACYSIRYTIYDFAVGLSDSIDMNVLNDAFLNRVVENIKYEKNAIMSLDSESDVYEYSSAFISQQLSLLMKNCKQLQSYVLAYLK